MKKIKLALVAVVLLASVSAVSFAQGGGGGGGGGGRGGRGGAGGGGVARLLTGVGDSATVAAKATEIFTKYQADIAAGRAGRGATPDSAAMKKAKDATDARNKEIRALLTKPADQAAFDKNVAAQAAGGRGGK